MGIFGGFADTRCNVAFYVSVFGNRSTPGESSVGREVGAFTSCLDDGAVDLSASSSDSTARSNKREERLGECGCATVGS